MKTSVDLSALPPIERKGRIAILKSKWYPELVENMARACAAVLTEYG